MDSGDGQLVNVFWREDGSVLFNETWGSDPLSPSMSARPNALNSRSAGALAGALTNSGKSEAGGESTTATVWSLVQVFIQFSREVDGGNVQRLVFREPLQPVGKRRVFGAAPQGRATTQQRPVVIHIAHDALFVVTVAELLPPEALQLQRVKREIPGEHFAHELLLHFAAEQASFSRQQELSSAGGAPAATPRQSGSPASRANRGSPSAAGGTAAHAARRVESPPVSGQQMMSASYGSGTSDSGSYESYESSARSRSYSTSSHEDQAPKKSTPMMPVDKAVISGEVQRILSSYRRAP